MKSFTVTVLTILLSVTWSLLTRLPYDAIPADPPTAVEQMAKAIDNIIVQEAIRKI